MVNNASDMDLALTAAHDFEPWTPGLEPEMTPAALHDAAPFLSVYFAYKTMFRTKEQLMESASGEAGFDKAQALLDAFDEADAWFKMIGGMVASARGRILVSLAAAAMAIEAAA